MNKIPYFFLILLITVLVFISAKPEGFDISRNVNYLPPKVSTVQASIDPEKDDIVIVFFTPANIAIFTIGFVLFIIMVFLIMKLNSMNTSTSS